MWAHTLAVSFVLRQAAQKDKKKSTPTQRRAACAEQGSTSAVNRISTAPLLSSQQKVYGPSGVYWTLRGTSKRVDPTLSKSMDHAVSISP